MTDFAAYRRVLAKMDDDYRAYYTDEELAETPAQRKARLQAPATPKGVCPKCNEHIGRGLHMHMKACGK